jgi:hypothetical protein
MVTEIELFEGTEIKALLIEIKKEKLLTVIFILMLIHCLSDILSYLICIQLSFVNFALHPTAQTRDHRTRDAKCTEVDCGIFEHLS